MSGVDPAEVTAWTVRRVEVALFAAERAQASADRLARSAALQEQLAASSSPVAARYARIAETQRAAERRMRHIAELQSDYVEMLMSRLASRDPGGATRPVLMNAVARAVGWPSAVLTLSDDTEHGGLVASSDETARHVHELEVVLGEGPSWEARGGGFLHAAGPALQSRWPLLGPTIVQLGVHAVAAAPLRLGPKLTGALTVLGPADVHRDDRRLAEMVTAIGQSLVSRLNAGHDDLPDLLGLMHLEDADFQPVLHQAAGALRARTGVRIEDAIALIRAHACAEDRPVAAVAADVLDGLLLEP